MIDYKQTGDYVAAQKLELACRNLQHLLKIQDEQITLEAIVESLQNTIIDTHGGNDTDFSDILAAQTRILDATFNFYIDKSKDAYSADDKVNIALRAQSQTLRTINTWKKLSAAKSGTEKRGTN